MQLITGSPFSGAMLAKLIAFLQESGLDYDEQIAFSAALVDNDEIIATGSLDGMVLKCIAVSEKCQGEDLTGQIMTCLMAEAARRGQKQLMLYTKPRNQYLFRAFGFHPLVRTADCLMMENRRDGLSSFLSALEKPADNRKPTGCIVANCNPFTLGHRYLIEQAAGECAWVHLFILSENRGMFSPEDRLAMAKLGCADLPNVLIHSSGPYMVSSATFPSYFIKDKARVEDIHCELDVRLFGEKIAPALGLTHRYVGTEPNCPVTRRYNEVMTDLLPGYGVEVKLIARRSTGDDAISASRVRKLIQEEQFDALNTLLPESSLKYIMRKRS